MKDTMRANFPAPSCYSLDSSYTLVPFWDEMIWSSHGDSWEMMNYEDILPTFRKEFVVLVDCLAVCSGLDHSEMDVVLKKSKLQIMKEATTSRKSSEAKSGAKMTRWLVK